MRLAPRPDWAARALRFTAFTPGVDACLLGTRNVDHLQALVAAFHQGPLPRDERAEIELAFTHAGASWPGLV